MPFIYGGVKDSATGVLIANAQVTCPTGNVVMNHGSYTCSVSPNSVDTLTASAPGYTSQQADIPVGTSNLQKNWSLVHT